MLCSPAFPGEKVNEAETIIFVFIGGVLAWMKVVLKCHSLERSVKRMSPIVNNGALIVRTMAARDEFKVRFDWLVNFEAGLCSRTRLGITTIH